MLCYVWLNDLLVDGMCLMLYHVAGHVFIFVASLGPDVVLAVLCTSWQWHLGLFNFVGLCLSLLQWGALFFLVYLQEVFVCTLLQWLQHLCLMSWILLIVLVIIFKNEKCLLLIVFKWGAVIVKCPERYLIPERLFFNG